MEEPTQLSSFTHQWLMVSGKWFRATHSWFHTSFRNDWYTVASAFNVSTEYIPIQIKEWKGKFVTNLKI